MPSEVQWEEAVARFDAAAQAYFHFHRMRFDYLLSKVRESVARLHAPLQILDIGPSFQTLMVQQAFPECVVHTLGFHDNRFREGIRGEHHYFDLNSSHDARAWLPLPPFDLVLMAEVLEHVAAPAPSVFRCVASWMKPSGELLLQTPNAVSLAKRMRMLRGYNPYMMLREPGDYSAHMREYTIAELGQLGRQAGLEVLEASARNYFAHQSRGGEVYRRLCDLLPETLRDGITVCYRRAG
jgi:trans-aconitate methyltransferase